MKNRYILYTALLVLLLSIILGVTYSYLIVKINNPETSSTINVEGGKLYLTYENNTGNIILENITPGISKVKQFTLTGTNDTKSNSITTNTDLKYKIGIVIDNNTFSEGALTYSLTKDSSSSSNGKLADDSSGNILRGGTQYIGTGYFSSGAKNAKHIYNLEISFPDTKVDQSIDQGASFACHVTIVDANVSTLTDYITNLDKSANGLEQDDTADTNLRYVGANPNNYIEFNNEMWRIIGIFNVYNVDTNKTEKLVKIIRNDSLGEYSWDSSDSTINSGYGVNEWSQADIMTELNTDYINPSPTSETTLWYNGSTNFKTASYDYSKNIKSNSIDKIAKVRWNLGGYNTWGVSALNMYNAERGMAHISSPSDGITRTDTWDGKIALMYPSDYGYASTGTACRNRLYKCDDADSKANNWLFNSANQWTLSPFSGYADYVFRVASDGHVGNDGASNTNGVRPALFLKSDVLMYGGNGIQSNPYKIEARGTFSNDSWETIANNVKSGNTSNYNVGDEKEVEIDGKNYTVRLANKSKPEECNGTNFSQTACGFVVEFVDIVEKRAMNTIATNVGGWPATEISQYANGEFLNKLPSDLYNVIIDTEVISGHSSEDKNNFTSTDKIYLLSINEIYMDENDTTYKQTRQLDYYKINKVSYNHGDDVDKFSAAIKKYNSFNDLWWLRSASNNTNDSFGYIIENGAYNNLQPIYTFGFAPAFRIG